MKIAVENISSEDFYQASFPPFTRGYEAMPSQLNIEKQGTIENLETLHSFSTSDIVSIVSTLENKKQLNLLLSTSISNLEFIAGVRALRTLIAILDEENNDYGYRKINFFIEITHSNDTAQELLFAQFAQVDSILCEEQNLASLKLLIQHLPTLPIDALFGNEDLETATNRIVENVYAELRIKN